MSGEESRKTGTTTIGIKINDGVVLAADTQASMGNMVSSKDIQKILKINDRIGITTAGSVGDAQYLVRIIKSQAKMYEYEEKRKMSIKSLATLLSNILQQNKVPIPFMNQLIVGGYDGEGPKIGTLDPLGGLIFEDKFTATGSGSPMAYGLLEDDYSEDMSLDDAKELGKRAVQAASQRDIYTGDKKVQVVSVSEEGFDGEFIEV